MILAAIALAWLSRCFDDATALIDRPILPIVAGLCAAGLIFFHVVPRLIQSGLDTNARTATAILGIMVVAGLATRLVLFASVPILEDDFYRYLWDGSVVAEGGNPYLRAPADVATGMPVAQAPVFAASVERVLERIGHADLRTIYPPIAQAAFAAAYLIEPWSLTAWRAVLLALDAVTLGLILLLLKDAKRSPLWATIYWWNPVVITTLFNGAHMDVVVLVPLLLALRLAGRGAGIPAAGCLALAVGAKVWPVLLLPLVLRPLVQHPWRLAAAIAVFSALIVIAALPILQAGLDATSGFTAYAQGWQRNSAIFPVVEGSVAWIFDGVGLPSDQAGLAARALLAVACGAVSLGLAIRPVASAGDLMTRAGLIVATLVLAAPAQYPWYYVWLAPFLAFQPWAGFLLLSATLPLYYTAFYFAPRQQIDVFNAVVVWIIWVPVWAMLAHEAVRRRVAPQDR